MVSDRGHVCCRDCTFASWMGQLLPHRWNCAYAIDDDSGGVEKDENDTCKYGEAKMEAQP